MAKEVAEKGLCRGLALKMLMLHRNGPCLDGLAVPSASPELASPSGICVGLDFCSFSSLEVKNIFHIPLSSCCFVTVNERQLGGCF